MVERKKIFSLSPSEQLRIQNEINDAVDPDRLNFISIDNLVNPDIPKVIKCEICKGLAHNAIQDESCEQLFCKHCITNRLKKSSKCPATGCSDDFKAANRISRLSRETLDLVLVKCLGENCDEPPKNLNDVLAHRSQCFIKKKPCIFGCG